MLAHYGSIIIPILIILNLIGVLCQIIIFNFCFTLPVWYLKRNYNFCTRWLFWSKLSFVFSIVLFARSSYFYFCFILLIRFTGTWKGNTILFPIAESFTSNFIYISRMKIVQNWYLGHSEVIASPRFKKSKQFIPLIRRLSFIRKLLFIYIFILGISNCRSTKYDIAIRHQSTIPPLL